MRAIEVGDTGSVEVLRVGDVPEPQPGPGQVRLRVAASGVNFIDVYFRRGLYPRDLPFVLGQEAAGVVDAVGEGVGDFAVGDRVACERAPGSHAEAVVIDAARAVPVPEHIGLDVAAAVMIQGLTAHFLATTTVALQPGMRALVHAASGGVGRLLVQVAKRCGATVYGTASSDAKAQAARDLGADEVIVYTQTDFADAVLDLTGGAGVDVVYDGVGRDTFDGSLRCLGRRGVLALFGQSSGPVPPFDPRSLAAGSKWLTRPGIGDYVATTEELRARAHEVFEWVRSGDLDVRIAGRYPLEEAAAAYEALEGRRVTGKLLLIP